jgi:hypothetical protein
MGRRAPKAILLAALAALAACSTTTPSPSASAASSQPAGVTLTALTDVDILPQTEATILAAFDADSAAALVASVPAGLDFASSGLICVYLGERSTGGWSLALQSASVVDGELQILAREGRPPASGGPAGTTYPAGCGTITRAGLPTGTVPVRADDTVSEEFIVSGTITVPGS